MSEKPIFVPPGSTAKVEEGQVFSPKFDADGLIICVVVDARTNEVLMVAHMDAVALARTIESGDAWFYSRSRATLWRKGETSGHVQRVIEIRVDCDQDALLLRVEQAGAGACHTGRRSCFYRSLNLGQPDNGPVALTFVDADKIFDPEKVYGKPTKQ
ncbi:MAG: phosphoribosyl-AMP cyclohydrolase [Bradyrhizobiaceae bacterium]|nr:phosphoribosyl-AMP cyclohydrolase [Bradyrhizobiaceae bacterium]